MTTHSYYPCLTMQKAIASIITQKKLVCYIKTHFTHKNLYKVIFALTLQGSATHLPKVYFN
jgi:hypothetical protein